MSSDEDNNNGGGGSGQRPDGTRESGGSAGGGGGGSPPRRTNSTESLGFTITGNVRPYDPDDGVDDDDDPPVTVPSPLPLPIDPTPPSPPMEPQLLHELPVIATTSSNDSAYLQFVRLNDWHIDFPVASGQAYAYQFGGRSVEPGAHQRVRPEDACPNPPDSAPVIGAMTILNPSSGTFILVRASLSCGYVGIVTTIKALIDVGISGAQQIVTDPGLLTFTKMLDLTNARRPQVQPPVFVRLQLFDQQMFAKLVAIKYPFPLVSPFEVIQLPGQAQPSNMIAPTAKASHHNLVRRPRPQ